LSFLGNDVLLLCNLIEVYCFIFFSFSLCQYLLKVFDAILQLLVFFFLHNQLLDKFLSLHLLFLVLSFQFSIFSPQYVVLAIDSLGNVRNQVQMMLDLSLSLLKLIAIFTSLHSLLLD